MTLNHHLWRLHLSFSHTQHGTDSYNSGSSVVNCMHKKHADDLDPCNKFLTMKPWVGRRRQLCDLLYSSQNTLTWKNVIERLQRLAFGPSFYSDWQPSSIKTVFYKISMTAWVFSNQQKSHRFTKKFSSNLELETTIQILAPHGRTMSSTHQNMKSSNILLAVWNSKPSYFHKSKGPSSFSESKFRRFIKIPDSSSVLYFPQI